MTRFGSSQDSCHIVCYGASSLRGGWVLSCNMSQSLSVFIIYTYIFVLHIFFAFYLFFNNPLFLLLHPLRTAVQVLYNRLCLCSYTDLGCSQSIDKWSIVCLTATNSETSYTSHVEHRLVQWCEYRHFHDFVWLLPAACIVLYHNRTSTEFWTPCANRGSVYALVNYRWCG